MSVLGIELDGVIIIFNREVELAEQRVGVGAVVISFGVFGIELDGFGIVLYRKLMLAQAALGKAAAGI